MLHKCRICGAIDGGCKLGPGTDLEAQLATAESGAKDWIAILIGTAITF